MNLKFTERRYETRLLLIFTGWASDARPFEGVSREGYDVAVAYDYRSLECKELGELDAYDEICVVGWSFGVIAATKFLVNTPGLPITARIAINGTLHPVDDKFGIPEAVFQGTLAGLSPGTLARFERRMCGSQRTLAKYREHAPQRNIDELADELRSIAALPHMPECANLWDVAYVSDNDYIIPSANQLAAWKSHPDVRVIAGPHFPPFAEIVQTAIINKQLVAERFGQAVETYGENAKIQAAIAQRLAQRIASMMDGGIVESMLEFGVGVGFLTDALIDRLEVDSRHLWDVAPMPERLSGRREVCDAEVGIRSVGSECFDLIAGSSAMQWFNSAPTFLKLCNMALKDAGLLAVTTFGPENFNEISGMLPVGLHYHDAAYWRRLLEASGYEDVVVAEERMTLTFDTPAELLRHIRQTGVNALSGSTSAALRIMRSGIRTLTYHPIYLLSRKNREQK